MLRRITAYVNHAARGWQERARGSRRTAFAVAQLISPNKRILAEWSKPGISRILHDCYNQDDGRNAFHRLRFGLSQLGRDFHRGSP